MTSTSSNAEFPNDTSSCRKSRLEPHFNGVLHFSSLPLPLGSYIRGQFPHDATIRTHLISEDKTDVNQAARKQLSEDFPYLVSCRLIANKSFSILPTICALFSKFQQDPRLSLSLQLYCHCRGSRRPEGTDVVPEAETQLQSHHKWEQQGY